MHGCPPLRAYSNHILAAARQPEPFQPPTHKCAAEQHASLEALETGHLSAHHSAGAAARPPAVQNVAEPTRGGGEEETLLEAGQAPPRP
mmetsp:Transcript_6668/g.12641  ORF Transcript_6668/g.12641 Transcript_6668/m.12641 type:complete len:89 (+) Transcript_6668:1475-1741(+)